MSVASEQFPSCLVGTRTHLKGFSGGNLSFRKSISAIHVKEIENVSLPTSTAANACEYLSTPETELISSGVHPRDIFLSRCFASLFTS